MNIKIKTITIFSTVFFFSCAPHIDYYKPLAVKSLLFVKKNSFENRNNFLDHYYFSKLNDSLEANTNLIVSSLPKKKNIFFHIGFNKPIKIDSVKISSKRIQTKLLHQTIVVKNFTDRYSVSFTLNDHKWYGKFKKKRDTLNVSVYYNNQVFKLPYFYNLKNSLETYPY